jgi:hypothetical protein
MLCHLLSQFKLWHVIVSWISMNEARVVIVHHSKSKKDNLNVYIYCCHYHAEVRKKRNVSSKGRTNKKNRTSWFLNMYYLYWYKYVCAEKRLINTFKKNGYTVKLGYNDHGYNEKNILYLGLQTNSVITIPVIMNPRI